MDQTLQPLPVAESDTGLRVLLALARQRTPLAALEAMHAEIGDVFQITLPSFKPVVLVGSEWNRYLLVTDRDRFCWRIESDPVTQLLGHGLLVEDGESHDHLRKMMETGLHRRRVNSQVELMCRYADEILAHWEDGSTVDMLVEMRRIALLILIGALFQVDFMPDMARLWRPILRAIAFISPGLWLISPRLPRRSYKRDLRELDEYLYHVIRLRRSAPRGLEDWLTHLIAGGMSDRLLRDQMLTMLIAGHDTSTALLAWTLYLLGGHQWAMIRAQAEVDWVLGQQRPTVKRLEHLRYLEQVIKESLRLYPPIHVGNRITNTEVSARGYTIPQNSRVMYSIYLSHRDEARWTDPKRFAPERFDRSLHKKQPALTYLPFGGGPRNCIGAAFAQVESKVVLARILQLFELQLVPQKIRPHMGATLEPRPGVLMRVSRRRVARA